jgi:hypothetical protein
MTENELYEVNKYADRLQPGKSMKIEHSLSLTDYDISELIRLPRDILIQRYADSSKNEKAIFSQLQDDAKRWEEHAAFTSLLERAAEYVTTPEIAHSLNQWVTDDYDNHSVSNKVYKMSYSVYMNTRYDSKKRKSVPTEWALTWDVRINSPITDNQQYSNAKIAGQDRKKFDNKTAMENYLAGRIKVYSELFTEISPPIPKKYEKFFKVNGILLPGYTVAGKAQPTISVADADVPQTSVLAAIAADKEAKRAKSTEREKQPAQKKKRTKSDTEL